MNAKPLCIYHHGCTDGFAAAWVVRKFFGEGEVDFHPGIYGEAPPDVTGRNVIIVDFSYKRDVMLTLIEQAMRVLVLDHHQTAAEDLANLPAKAQVIFDMERSGARIAWDHFFQDQQAPLLIDYIQDRDLWEFRLPSTKAVTSALYSYPMDFIIWDSIMESGVRTLINEGLAINRKQQTDVAALVENASRWINFGGLSIRAANVPWMYASDVGHELGRGEPFAATYYDDEDGRRWSLRSHPEGADVAKIAEAFGGGGHKHAAGFRMTHEQASEFERTGHVSGESAASTAPGTRWGVRNERRN